MSKVLLVEDDASARRLLEFTMQQAGYQVCTAGDGKQALEVAQAEQPDVIVMDVMMPVMAGYEATLRLKEIPTTSHIPILILTARSHPADREYSLMAGADDVMAQPVEPQEVVAHVRQLIEQGTRPA